MSTQPSTSPATVDAVADDATDRLTALLADVDERQRLLDFLAGSELIAA